MTNMYWDDRGNQLEEEDEDEEEEEEEEEEEGFDPVRHAFQEEDDDSEEEEEEYSMSLIGIVTNTSLSFAGGK